MGWKLGDVRGVLEVPTVIESQLAQGAKLNIIVLGLVAATGTIIILACVYFARKIAAPLSRMSIAFRKLRDQDFDIDVSDTGRADELGTLARGIEAFEAESMKAAELRGEQEALQKRPEQERSELLTGMIAEFEKNVGAVVDSVATAAKQMNNLAELMSQSSGQTTSESEGIASAAESALSSVQTMASAAEELTASVSEIGNQVSHSNEITEAAVAEATAALEEAIASGWDVSKA